MDQLITRAAGNGVFVQLPIKDTRCENNTHCVIMTCVHVTIVVIECQ